MCTQVTGDCLYPDWIASYFIPLIHRTSSITILPNYRLTPESPGSAILEDLSDFWKWFHSGAVSTFLSSQGHDLDLDFSRVLATGDSAGGYMALMSALTQPKGSINAVLAQYPMTSPLTCEPAATFFGMPAPGPEVAEQHISSMTSDAVISSVVPPARMALSYSLVAYGHYLKHFGDDAKLWPVGLIGEAKSMPPTWIVHGDADVAVDIGGSRKFAEVWEKGGVEGEVRMHVEGGANHGFDIATKESEAGWLREGLEWIEGCWLKK